MLKDDGQMSECHEASYEEVDVNGVKQKVCSVCRQICGTTPETLEIKASEDIHLKDVGPGQR